MKSETTNEIVKRFLDILSRETPISLERLNIFMGICLAAYAADGTDKTKFLRENDVYVRDLLYDIIYPGVPKKVREAVDVLCESGTMPVNAAEAELIYSGADRTAVKDLINIIANRYYPMVINEPVYTPEPINKLCAAILNPIAGSFYDGVSGTGSTFISAWENSQRNEGELAIFAQEKIKTLCAVSVIRAYVNGLDFFEVVCGDVLANPGFAQKGIMQQFDYSIMFPPLGSSWTTIEREVSDDRYGRFYEVGTLTRSNAEWLFIWQQIASLKNDCGRGVIAVSTGTLFNSAYKMYRQKLICEGYIDCIITLPSKILPFTTTPLSLMVVSKRRREAHGVMMIQADRLFEKDSTARVADLLTEEVIGNIVFIADSGKCEPEVGRTVGCDELMSSDCVLLPSRYVRRTAIDSEFGTVSVDLSGTAEMPEIAEVSRKIYRGLNISSMAEENAGGKYKIINYADVQDGHIDMMKVKTYSVNDNVEAKKYEVAPGDVLVSCKGGMIKTCVVPDGVDNVLLSINYIGIRLDKTKCLPYYLKQYLDSPVGQVYLRGRQVGTSIVTLKNKDIEEMPVPLIPLEKQRNYISEYEDVQAQILAEIQNLYHRLADEKWRLYQNMGLDVMMNKGEDRDDAHTKG